jgi:hypothetical protein
MSTLHAPAGFNVVDKIDYKSDDCHESNKGEKHPAALVIIG